MLRMTAALCAVIVLATTGVAFAHERRAAGPVELSVGWASEPAYVGAPNGVQVTVRDGSGAPVADLSGALQAEVSFGDQKLGPLALEAVSGEAGRYEAALIPTRLGDYDFRIFGEVRGEKVDLTFRSADKKFDSVKSSSDVEFPAKDPSRSELAQRVERMEPRIGEASDASESARSTATIGLILGVVGILLGAIALILALGARRSRSA